MDANSKDFLFLRGARLLEAIQQHLEELTIDDLGDNIERGFPETTKRQYATDPIRITQLRLIPYVGTRTLLASATASSNGKIYKPKIMFLDVVFEDEDTPNNVTFTGSDNETYNIQPISLKENNVRVHCTCLDFYWRFAVWDKRDKALYGRAPGPYQRKTNRPPVNPLQVSGICKHLIKTVTALRQAGLVTD